MIRMDGKYRTRDGREVRLYAVDGAGDYPVHGAAFSKAWDGWVSTDWNIKGKSCDVTIRLSNDLIEIKPAAIDQLCDLIIKWRDEFAECNPCFNLMNNVLTEARRIKAEMEDVG